MVRNLAVSDGRAFADAWRGSGKGGQPGHPQLSQHLVNHRSNDRLWRKPVVMLPEPIDAHLLTREAVPVVRRLLYGFLAREGLRLSEALSLRWLHLDIGRSTLNLDENKTDDPRVWALDPSVARALELWHGLVRGDERATRTPERAS